MNIVVVARPPIVEALRHALTQVAPAARITVAADLDSGLATLRGVEPDLVVLDALADCGLGAGGNEHWIQGVESRLAHAQLAVIDARSDTVPAPSRGRQPATVALSEDDLHAGSVQRLLDLTTERLHHRAELVEAQRREQLLRRELDAFRRLHEGADVPVTAQAFGLRSVKDTLGGEYAQLLTRYNEALDAAIDLRVHKADGFGPSVSGRLLDLSRELGFLRATPRDVRELHMTVLRDKLRGAVAHPDSVYLEEGRMILLELLGDLVLFYRKYALSAASPGSAPATGP